MKTAIISAIITGVCTIIAAIIAAIIALFQSKIGKNKKKDNNKIQNHSENHIDIPAPKHPKLLNPDEYDIDDENYFITLGGLFQQSRNTKDVKLKKLKKVDRGK